MNGASLLRDESRVPLHELRAALRVDQALDLVEHLFLFCFCVDLDGLDSNSCPGRFVHAALHDTASTVTEHAVFVELDVLRAKLVLLAAQLDPAFVRNLQPGRCV